LSEEEWLLVVTRKVGEWIVIDDDIGITVVELKRGSVTIGIEAPSEVTVTRLGEQPLEIG
jgi:carbon storage regulator